MIHRGEIHWVDLGEPVGSRAGTRRPVLIVSADAYNASKLATVLALIVTSNTAMAAMPGNVFLPSGTTGLRRDAVVNVTALVTLNKVDLEHRAGLVHSSLMRRVDQGLRTVLGLAPAR